MREFPEWIKPQIEGINNMAGDPSKVFNDGPEIIVEW